MLSVILCGNPLKTELLLGVLKSKLVIIELVKIIAEQTRSLLNICQTWYI